MSNNSKQGSKSTTSTAMTPPAAPVVDEKAIAEAAAYEQFAGAGFEGQTAEDLTIPFLVILQGLSRQLQDNSELRQGMIFNTVTGDFAEGKDGIAFIPVVTQHLFVEWKPRAQGGGFVGQHQATDPIVVAAKNAAKEFGKYSTPAGNDLIETFYVWGLSLGEGGDDCIEVVLAFTGTQIKKYKTWMTKARTIQIQLPDGRRIPAPLFAHRYRLKTVGEKNAKGSWHTWDIGFDATDAASARLLPSDMRFQAAVKMKKLIEEGRAKAAHESTRSEAEAASGGPSGGPSASDKPVF